MTKWTGQNCFHKARNVISFGGEGDFAQHRYFYIQIDAHELRIELIFNVLFHVVGRQPAAAIWPY